MPHHHWYAATIGCRFDPIVLSGQMEPDEPAKGLGGADTRLLPDRLMANKSSRMTFSEIARRVSDALGTHWAFLLASASIVAWAVAGPVFGYSETWQLVVNTATTIVTFLMVFLIQNTQNRDSRAMHLKLDEIIHSLGKARDGIIDLENRSDDEIKDIASEFEVIGNKSKDCD